MTIDRYRTSVLLRTAILLAVSLAPFCRAAARNVYVSPSGDDAAAGTLERPLATIQRASKTLAPGDTCFLRAGKYHQGLSLRGLHGSPEAPITFKPYKNESVTLDGTVAIDGPWQQHIGRVYKTRLEQDVWQLFVDGRMMTYARWPNAHLHDGTLWDRYTTWRHIRPESTFGVTLDGPPEKEIAWPPLDRDERRRRRTCASLAESGIDATGAIAILNIGSWLTWAQTVEKHQPGSDRFTYGTDFSRSGRRMAAAAQSKPGDPEFWNRKNRDHGEGHYYLEGLLSLLDAPGEWYYNPQTQWLYVWMPDGSSPSEYEIRGKTQTYAISARNSSHLSFEGIQFFATTFQFLDCHNLCVENCNFLYPSYSRRALGDYRRPAVTTISASTETPSRNILRNCRFEYMDGPAVEMKGRHDLIENCYFHDIDFSCLGTGGEGTINLIETRDLTFRRNTVHTAGNSEGVRLGNKSLVELNRVYNTGLLQSDGSAINAGVAAIEGAVIRRNWCHDTAKAGIRFDSSGMGTPAVKFGLRGAVVGNVVWNTKAIKIKGDEHRIVGNTCFDSHTIDLGILDRRLGGGINKKTVTQNNAVAILSGEFGRSDVAVPGVASHNWVGNVGAQLCDPDRLDFRPRINSQLIDGGTIVSGARDEYVGAAPDIGAYEHGDKEYWIPGYQSPQPSTPIPPDGASEVSSQADLMWLAGYRSASHDIYLGTDLIAVTEADHSSPEYMGQQQNNIFTPQQLRLGMTFYWRIDAVGPDKTVRGSVWSFTP